MHLVFNKRSRLAGRGQNKTNFKKMSKKVSLVAQSPRHEPEELQLQGQVMTLADDGRVMSPRLVSPPKCERGDSSKVHVDIDIIKNAEKIQVTSRNNQNSDLKGIQTDKKMSPTEQQKLEAPEVKNPTYSALFPELDDSKESSALDVKKENQSHRISTRNILKVPPRQQNESKDTANQSGLENYLTHQKQSVIKTSENRETPPNQVSPKSLKKCDTVKTEYLLNRHGSSTQELKNQSAIRPAGKIEFKEAMREGSEMSNVMQGCQTVEKELDTSPDAQKEAIQIVENNRGPMVDNSFNEGKLKEQFHQMHQQALQSGQAPFLEIK